MPLLIRWAIGIAGAFVACLLIGWLAVGKDWRALLSDPPTNTQVLFWSQSQRDAGFRMLDRIPLVSKKNTIAAGKEKPLVEGEPLLIDVDVDAYMAANRHAAIIVLQNGKVRLEEYGLGFTRKKRWTSFSVGKSLTSTLVGAAIEDGYIKSVDEPIVAYIPALAGSSYDGVTIEQVLTMTSGVRWIEDYEDPSSDVALFNRHKPEDGLDQVVSYMRTLPRAHPPGEVWNYSTGETNLIGILVGNAVGKPIATYLSEKIWKPYGMGADATWLLGTDGRELSGCCIQAATRDMARFGQFVLEGGVINGVPVLPPDWIETATRTHADIGEPGRGYGYQWWTYESGAFAAVGIFGQGIFVDPTRNLVVAVNSNWTSARGRKTGEFADREAFYNSVQAAIDREEALVK
ncbi:MAG: serine hydrolase [Pseudomonadota bacterium]